MNKIQEVKERADIVKVAKYFGVKNKQCCPFHREKTASFSISHSKQIFKCFGCGLGGDVIALVQKLLNINAYEAAKQINYILGLGIDFGKKTSSTEINKYKQNQEAKERFKIWHNKTLQMLIDYVQSLKSVEKLQKQETLDYYIDLLIYGTEEDILWFKKTESKYIEKIKSTLKIS